MDTFKIRIEINNEHQYIKIKNLLFPLTSF